MYNFIIGKGGSQEVITLGEGKPEAKNWLVTHKQALSEADYIQLEPKERGLLPRVRVLLDGGKKAVFFKKVTGTLNTRTGEQRQIAEVFHIGWEEGLKRIITAVSLDGVTTYEEEINHGC